MLAAACSAWWWRRALRPIDRLSEAAERVARDQDLTAPVPEPGTDDEVGRLTRSFNTMRRRWPRRAPTTAAGHRRQPRAPHPLTSLRTTIELLRRADRTAGAAPPTEATLPPEQH